MISVDELVVWGGDDAPPPFRRKPSCHMFADSTEELVAFAKRIGLRPFWIQEPGTAREHFDLTANKRARAVRYGAREISLHEAGELIHQRRVAEEARP